MDDLFGSHHVDPGSSAGSTGAESASVNQGFTELHGSNTEVQKVLSENRKLRQENRNLKIQLIELGNSSKRKVREVEDNSSQASVQAESIDPFVEQNNKSSSSRRSSTADKETIAKLNEQIGRLQGSNRQLQESIGSFTLVHTEREYAYIRILEQMEEEKKEREKRIESLTIQLEAAKEHAALQAVTGAPAAHSAAPSAITAAAEETLEWFKGNVGVFLNRMNHILASEPSRVSSLPPLSSLHSSTKGKISRSRSKRVDVKEKLPQESEEAEAFFSPSDDSSAFGSQQAHSFRFDANMSSTFREELMLHQSQLGSKVLAIPKGAGALRSTPRANPEPHGKKRRAMSQTSVKSEKSSQDEGRPQSIKNGSSNAKRFKEEQKVKLAVNPFEGVQLKPGEVQAHERTEAWVQGNGNLPAGAAIGLVEAKSALECYFAQVSHSSTASSLSQYKKELLSAYGGSFQLLAQDTKQLILSRCTAACRDIECSSLRFSFTLSYAAAPEALNVPAAQQSYLETWVTLWNAISSSPMEGVIWELVQQILSIDHQLAFDALQGALTASIPQHLKDGLPHFTSSIPVTSTAASLPFSSAESVGTVQLHALCTMLNFLWLQYLIPLQRTAYSEEEEGKTQGASSTSPAKHRFQEVVATIRRCALQLIHDGSLVALQEWNKELPEGVGPQGEEEFQEEGKDGRSTKNECAWRATRKEYRAVVIRLWLTLWRGLLGANVHRQLLLECVIGKDDESALTSHLLYYHLFRDNFLTPKISFEDILKGAELSTIRFDAFTHGPMLYTIQTIMRECLQEVAESLGKDVGGPKEQAAQDTVGSAEHCRGVWEYCTESLAWSVDVPSTQSIIERIIRLVLDEKKGKGGKRITFEDHPPSTTNRWNSLLQWEAKSSAALLGLRMIVLFKGFNFISTVLQPLLQGKEHEDDVMAYILSAAVLDFNLVCSKESEVMSLPPSTDGDGPTSGSPSQRAALSFPAVTESGVGARTQDTDMYERLLRFLLEYATSREDPVPFDLHGTIRISSMAAVLNFLQDARPKTIQHFLTPLQMALTKSLSDFAAGKQISIDANLTKVLSKVLSPQCAWNLRAGRLVQEALLFTIAPGPKGAA